jgi:hypothetical protein
MKKVLLIVGVVALVVLAAAGGFYGGIQYQTSKVNQVQANFERARGQFPNGQLPSGAAGFSGAGGQANGQFTDRRGGITGQVKTIEGNVLTISTAEDVTTINLSDDTQIQKTEMVTLSTSDLQPGMRVMIVGQKDSNGNVSASQVMILNDIPANPALPAATEKAP